MATIAWLLNLDADRELADPQHYAATPLPAETLRELRTKFLDLVQPTDVLLESPAHQALTHDASAQHPSHALAFCPTPSALARIAACGFSPPAAPSLSVLCAVNHRRFCAQLAEQLGDHLPGARYVDDLDTLQAHLHNAPSFTGVHVIKRAHSFAGRDQRRVIAGELDVSTLGFCRRSFARGDGVQVEPWVSRVVDCSLHGYLQPNGTLLSATPRTQHVDAMGRFVAVTADAPTLRDEHLATLHATLDHTARALHAAGYFGPFGIDGFSYRDRNDHVAFTPRCEINARFSMGYPRSLLETALLEPDQLAAI